MRLCVQTQASWFSQQSHGNALCEGKKNISHELEFILKGIKSPKEKKP